ncbi:hypothetical protein B0H66DRAFT_138374 [Apodospora peruviana]|uniref:G-patch domain-containing protein n=1 Tax=Apodospora peruviana TaxID=516989 RepID=A0AAE0IIW3_9PEZI|nr:hypothetical protein B0H66DRAFT_138374 [Apodospora peruviana]
MAAPAPRGTLSLYANLLPVENTDSLPTASGQPAQGTSQNNAPAKKPVNPALMFQPIRRPQQKQQNKPKAALPQAFTVAAPAATNGGNDVVPTARQGPPVAPQQRSTLADWAATEDDEYLYGSGGGGAQHQHRRGGRRKKKKTDEGPRETNWDDMYDPTRPTNVEEYLRSDERWREVTEWKDVLYAHRRKKRRSSYGDSNTGSDEEEDRRPMGNQFAPPAALSFAPPPVSPPRVAAADAAAAAPVVPVLPPDDATGDDAYARRLALSGMGIPPPPPPPAGSDLIAQALPPQPPTASGNGAIISRAPVRYDAPPGGNTSDVDMTYEDDDDDDEQDYNYMPTPIGGSEEDTQEQQQPRTSRPGQAGFAERLMSKYGWSKGSGLGANESGITTALRVKVEKRRKRPDAEGGGFAEPGGRGKIIAPPPSKKRKGDEGENEDGGFGKTSEVIVLRNMLENIPDLDQAIEAGNMIQDIGDECSDKYGTVERLYIDKVDRQVFVKFTSQASALRAVNNLEGRIYNGNAIVAKFYDADKFEKGVYR